MLLELEMKAKTTIFVVSIWLAISTGFYIPTENVPGLSSKFDGISSTVSKSGNKSFSSANNFGTDAAWLLNVKNENEGLDLNNLTSNNHTSDHTEIDAATTNDESGKAIRVRREGQVQGDDKNLRLYIQTRNVTGRENRQFQRAPEECSAIPDPGQQPFMCYQCSSSFNDRDPVCDHTLWRFTRRSDKYKLRMRCPHGRGDYCVKKVQTQRGAQLTERGCFGPGPVAGRDGSLIGLQEGCVTYRQNGFLTTTCLCKGDLCNGGGRLGHFGGLGAGQVIVVAVLAMQLVL